MTSAKIILILLITFLLVGQGYASTQGSVVYYLKQINNSFFTTQQIQTEQTIPTNSILSTNTLSVECIDKILSQANSLASGTGKKFFDSGKQYNIDPAAALAFFRKESTFGKYGVAAKTKSIGNIKCTTSNCYNGFNSYNTWDDGIEAWYKLISGKTYVGVGLDTIEEIIPKYAPSSENDTQLYITQVKQWMNEYREYSKQC